MVGFLFLHSCVVFDYVPCQWREASFTTSEGAVTRVFTVCNVAVANTDTYLYVPFIERQSANRIHVQVRFSIRQCANYPNPTVLQQCKVKRIAFALNVTAAGSLLNAFGPVAASKCVWQSISRTQG